MKIIKENKFSMIDTKIINDIAYLFYESNPRILDEAHKYALSGNIPATLAFLYSESFSAGLSVDDAYKMLDATKEPNTDFIHKFRSLEFYIEQTEGRNTDNNDFFKFLKKTYKILYAIYPYIENSKDYNKAYLDI